MAARGKKPEAETESAKTGQGPTETATETADPSTDPADQSPGAETETGQTVQEPTKVVIEATDLSPEPADQSTGLIWSKGIISAATLTAGEVLTPSAQMQIIDAPERRAFWVCDPLVRDGKTYDLGDQVAVTQEDHAVLHKALVILETWDAGTQA